MNTRNLLILLLGIGLTACADMGSLGGTKYGTEREAVISERFGMITQLETVRVEKGYKLGVGTAVCAVAGGLLGSAIGDSKGATVAGAVIGGVAGTVAESKLGGKNDAQRVTVRMSTGGAITVVQPIDSRLHDGMAVKVEGSGESARVVPR